MLRRCGIRDFPQIIILPDFAESKFLSGGEGAEMAAEALSLCLCVCVCGRGLDFSMMLSVTPTM